MTSSSNFRNTLVVAALVAVSACGPNIVGSRYVKSQSAVAGQPTVLTVNASESPELDGTRLEIPAGALGANTLLTVELGLTHLVGAELSGGPVAILGPVATEFSGDVTLTLPLSGVGANDDVSIVAEDANGLTWEIDAQQVVVDANRTRATFKLRRLGSFQPRRRVACTSNAQCPADLACVRGRCQAPTTQPQNDGGTSCAMSCPSGSVCEPMSQVCVQNTNACTSNADCPMNLACLSGACRVPNTTGCGMNAACPSGQFCANSVCIPVSSDGGTTNPIACMSSADCRMGESCVNGLCRAVCVPHVESCNGVDDDCDGVIDEGCMNSDGGVACMTDSDCAMGQSCVNGVCGGTNTDAGVACGGFAGTMCGAGMVCVDDPRDMCDPNNGGADCVGVCVVDAIDGGMPTDGGVTTDGGTDGGMNTDGGVGTDGGVDGGQGAQCGGIAGIQCGAGFTCVDVPNDMCDPMTANDCPGTCEAAATGDAGACMTSQDCAMGQSCVMGVCR